MDAVGSFAGTNTSMAYSGSIWGDCPVEALRDKQATGPLGFIWEKTFSTIPITPPTTEGNWGDMAFFSDTGGFATGSTKEIGGGVTIGSNDDNEGASMRTVVAPCKMILTGGDFWFEARILSSVITDTTTDIFLGMFENVAFTATVPIQASGAMADKNFVGFQRTETSAKGAFMNCTYKTDGNTQVSAGADAVTLVADTYTNLGMKFIPKRNVGKGPGYFLWFQDGVQIASYLVTTTAGNPFPNDINLGFAFAILNAAGSSPGSATIKHVRLAQLLTAMP